MEVIHTTYIHRTQPGNAYGTLLVTSVLQLITSSLIFLVPIQSSGIFQSSIIYINF